jgi:hypothetical protein
LATADGKRSRNLDPIVKTFPVVPPDALPCSAASGNCIVGDLDGEVVWS